MFRDYPSDRSPEESPESRNPSEEEIHSDELLAISRIGSDPNLHFTIEEAKKIESLLDIDRESRIALAECRQANELFGVGGGGLGVG